jgi:hypothetical protein
MNIFIGTPCYGGKLDLDYLNSIIDFDRIGLPYTLMGIRNESLITRGRNTIFSYFMNLPQFTHLLFLDADIGIASNDILRMMSHNKDVIGAPVRLKGTDRLGRPVYNAQPYPDTTKSSDLLQKVDRVGTAVFCLSRHACNKLAETAPRYEPSPLTKGTVVNMPHHYDVFQCGVKDGIYLSEDYWVCHALRDMGIDVWVDWGIQTRHWGAEVYV